MQFKRLDGGLYALYHFYDKPNNLKIAYQYIYGEWITNSEYDADDNRDNLEFCMNNIAEDIEGKLKSTLGGSFLLKLMHLYELFFIYIIVLTACNFA